MITKVLGVNSIHKSENIAEKLLENLREGLCLENSGRGLKKDSLLTVRLGAWGHLAFPSCGRLKEDSRYIFFMEPDANSSSRAPAAFRASFPPLETGRNLKKEVSRVLCKRCGKSRAPGGVLRPGQAGR